MGKHFELEVEYRDGSSECFTFSTAIAAAPSMKLASDYPEHYRAMTLRRCAIDGTRLSTIQTIDNRKGS